MKSEPSILEHMLRHHMTWEVKPLHDHKFSIVTC